MSTGAGQAPHRPGAPKSTELAGRARCTPGAARGSVVSPCRLLQDELVQGEVGDGLPEPRILKLQLLQSHTSAVSRLNGPIGQVGATILVAPRVDCAGTALLRLSTRGVFRIHSKGMAELDWVFDEVRNTDARTDGISGEKPRVATFHLASRARRSESSGDQNTATCPSDLGSHPPTSSPLSRTSIT